MSPALGVVLKFLWYFLSRLIIWGAAASLVLLAFFMAMDYMNASTLVKDGMQVRAEVVMKNSDPTTLAKVFSKGFLENDEILKSKAYSQYKITDFDYNADTEIALVFPWQGAVTLRVTEKVTEIVGQPLTGTDTGINETPPAWKNAVYNVQLVRFEESWRIISMELIDVLPAPTPTPSQTEALSPGVTETIAQ